MAQQQTCPERAAHKKKEGLNQRGNKEIKETLKKLQISRAENVDLSKGPYNKPCTSQSWA